MHHHEFVHSIPLNRFKRCIICIDRLLVMYIFVELCLDFLLNNFLSVSFFIFLFLILNITRMNRDFILIIIWVMDMEMRCAESPEW